MSKFIDVHVHTQVFDTDQVLYALSLLQAVLFVAPAIVIRSLASSVVSVRLYGSYDAVKSSLASNDQPGGQKSLLEIILLSLTSFIRSEYPDTLDVTPSDVVQNLRVKSTAVEMIGFLTAQFSLILSSTDISSSSADGGSSVGSGSLTHNPSYVSALVTLCDVQKVLLLTLSQVVKHLALSTNTSDHPSKNEDLKNESEEVTVTVTKTSTASVEKKDTKVEQLPSVPLRFLFVHLLRCLQNLISLEMQCIPSSPAAMTPNARQMKRSLSVGNLIQPGLSSAAQPFFQSLVMDVLTNSSLADLHTPLLHMFSAALPHLHSQLDDFAPKILRQLCCNLEAGVMVEKTRGEHSSKDCVSETAGGAAIVNSVQALVNIILWCLFGEYPVQQVLLQHNPLNRFWDASQLGRTNDSEEALSPTSKQPSAMSWLLGVFATATQHKAVSSPVGAKSPKLVLSQSKVGHSILLLLPAVYNALTEVWTWFSGRMTPHNAGGISSGSGNDRGIGRAGRRGREGGCLEAEKKKAEFEASYIIVEVNDMCI